MLSVILVVAIIGGIGWMIWRRRTRWPIPTAPEGIAPETLAMEAFTHGNMCLAEGKFAEATAAFHQSREFDPKRPHVAERLAEVERRQHAASQAPPTSAAS